MQMKNEVSSHLWNQLFMARWNPTKDGGREATTEQTSPAGYSLMSPCFLPGCLDCCLNWHNLFHSHSLCYGAAKRYPWPGFPSGFWGEEFTLRGSLYQLHANCALPCSPQNFLHLSLLFLFVCHWCSYFFPNDKVLGQECFLVMEFHRDFCQHCPCMEVTVLYGQRKFNCGTGKNNSCDIKRCYLLSLWSLQQMQAPRSKSCQG